MRRFFTFPTALMPIMLFAAVAMAGSLQPIERPNALVVSVHDVDTFECHLSTKINGGVIRDVRLGGGVDGPESKQPYGQKAAARTRELVKGKTVLVQVKGRSYDRLVGRVFVKEGRYRDRDLGLVLASEGLCWADPRYAKGDYGRQLKAAVVKAKAAKLGLWSQSNPVAPWEWRKNRKRK